MNQATEKGNGIDLRPEWGIFIPSVLVIILISIPAVLYPKAAEEVVSAIYQPFAANFGTLYLWITVGLIILCVYFACSRYGDIKFGDPDEKPEFSLSSWIAMIFCSGVAGAVMFWSIIEPLWDIVQPPQYAAPMSTQAYDWALAYLLLHWGPNAWCTYFITALPIAYMFHIRRKPFLRISSAADMIIGKQKDGLLGRCVDVFFILGLLFCTAVTMCISLPTVEAALARVFGITPSFGLEIAILFVSALLAGVTVYLGLKKGIKRLSDINVVIAPRHGGLRRAGRPHVLAVRHLHQRRGQDARQLLEHDLLDKPVLRRLLPTRLDHLLRPVLGGVRAVHGPVHRPHLTGAHRPRGHRLGDVRHGGGRPHDPRRVRLLYPVGAIPRHHRRRIHPQDAGRARRHDGRHRHAAVQQGRHADLLRLLHDFPRHHGQFRLLRGRRHRNPKDAVDADPHRYHCTFWAVAQGLLALGLLAMGGLEVAKIFGNFSGALMALPSLLLTACWLKIIREDGKDLLHTYRAKD